MRIPVVSILFVLGLLLGCCCLTASAEEAKVGEPAPLPLNMVLPVHHVDPRGMQLLFSDDGLLGPKAVQAEKPVVEAAFSKLIPEGSSVAALTTDSLLLTAPTLEALERLKTVIGLLDGPKYRASVHLTLYYRQPTLMYGEDLQQEFTGTEPLLIKGARLSIKSGGMRSGGLPLVSGGYGGMTLENGNKGLLLASIDSFLLLPDDSICLSYHFSYLTATVDAAGVVTGTPSPVSSGSCLRIPKDNVLAIPVEVGAEGKSERLLLMVSYLVDEPAPELEPLF